MRLGAANFAKEKLRERFLYYFSKEKNERMIRSVDGAKTAYLRSFSICIENLDNSENNP